MNQDPLSSTPSTSSSPRETSIDDGKGDLLVRDSVVPEDVEESTINITVWEKDVARDLELTLSQAHSYLLSELQELGFTGARDFLKDANWGVVSDAIAEVRAQLANSKQYRTRPPRNPGALIRWLVRQKGGAP